MACYTLYDASRAPRGHICGDLGPHCAECGDVGGYLCDYPVGEGQTCDRALCDYHAQEHGPELHYCAAHAEAFAAFRDAGGVRQVLENVTPYKRPPKRPKR